jgi:hypothetical protein
MAILHGVYLLLAILIGKSIAQNSSADLCSWTQLRAATVRDAVYVNGGSQITIDQVSGFNTLGGAVYTLNFSQPFGTNNKSSALFEQLQARHPKADYWDGTIFATDEKIYLYGYDYVTLAL